jgi:hypothetical protein
VDDEIRLEISLEYSSMVARLAATGCAQQRAPWSCERSGLLLSRQECGKRKCDKKRNTASVSNIQGPEPQTFVCLRPGHSGQFHAADSLIHASVS